MTVPRTDEFPDAAQVRGEFELLPSGHEDVYGLWDMAADVNT